MKAERNAVITGATTGIGRAIAEDLAREGYTLWVCARNDERLNEMRDYWSATFPENALHTLRSDVSKRSDVAAFAGHIRRATDRVDVLVNNAGLFYPGSVLDEAEGNLEEMINTNLYSAYWLTRELIGLMLPHRAGHIFNMCSIASFMAYPNGGSYAISKHAMLGLSRMLRAELMDKGIKVTTVMPGATWSASWEGADLPRERLMQASDISEAVMSALRMSPAAVVEDIVIRPQLGDL